MEFHELLNLISKENSIENLNSRRDEIADLIPEVRLMFEFDQQSKYHQYDLWMHTLHVLTGLPRDVDDKMLYLGALLHDIGKPAAQCKGKKSEDMYMHYYEHGKIGAQLVEETIMPRLYNGGAELSLFDHRRLIYYVLYHDSDIKTDGKAHSTIMEKCDEQFLRNLFLLQIADAEAHIQTQEIKERILQCRTNLLSIKN